MAISSITATVDTVDYVFQTDTVNPNGVILKSTLSTLGVPKTLTLKRVYPVKTKSFPGVARLAAKLSWNVTDSDGVVTPLICEFNLSRRADLSDTDVQLVRKLLSTVVLDGELDAFISNLSL